MLLYKLKYIIIHIYIIIIFIFIILFCHKCINQKFRWLQEVS